MSTLLTTQQINSYSQHTIQSQDLQDLWVLAKNHDETDSIESWTFDQWLGFAVFLFTTTPSSQIREQLAQQLPKFGSVVVFPLVKILHNARYPYDWRALALRSLMTLAPYPLVIGLVQALKRQNSDQPSEDLGPLIAQILAKLMAENDFSIVLLLSQLLSAQDWQALDLQSLANTRCSTTDMGMPEEEMSLRIRVFDQSTGQPLTTGKDLFEFEYFRFYE